MKTVRKTIGVFLIACFGLPTLFGIIWAVGLIRATVSPEFVSDLPREIIQKVPPLTDEIFQAAQDREIIGDESTRLWFQAAAKTNISPRQLMEKTGLLSWLENELSVSLRDIGKVFRGERRPRQMFIDLQPLKKALLHPDVDEFFRRTLENLPPCDQRGDQRWQELASGAAPRGGLPACRPSLAGAEGVFRAERVKAINDIPNQVEIFEDVHFLRFFPLGFSRTVHLLSYSLFFIPAIFIFFGALIAASSPSGFLKWSGVSVFIGSLPVLMISLFAKHLSLWALKFGSFSWGDQWSSDLHDLIADKLNWIPARIIDSLFSPVIAVAAVVCVVGVLLVALSFSVRGSSKKAVKPTTPVSAAVAPEPPAKPSPGGDEESKIGK